MKNNAGRLISILALVFSLCSPAFARASSGQDADALRAKAEQGDPVAQDRLGIMYYSGRGVPRDYAEAAKWFRKAAEQSNTHAERQLAQMYATGLGVPRDKAEFEKWSQKAAVQNPPAPATPQGLIFHSRFWLLEIFLIVAVFVCGLFVLQKETLPKWKRLLIAPFVHLIGLVLVLNSINTYGFQLFFPKCRGNDMTTSCYQYHFSDRVAHFLQTLGDLQIENLLFRFMMIMGFALDILAVWYLVYLYKRLFRRSAGAHANAASSLRRVPDTT